MAVNTSIVTMTLWESNTCSLFIFVAPEHPPMAGIAGKHSMLQDLFLNRPITSLDLI